MATKLNEFKRVLKKAFIDFFGGIKVYPGGVVFFGQSSYKLTGDDVRTLLELIEPGDVIINRRDYYVSNWFIEGNFSHVGLYVGDNRVIHVATDGIKNEDVIVFTRADALAIVRPKNKGLIPTAMYLAYELFKKGVRYDYDFNTESPEEFYCTEFTDYCYGYSLRNTLPNGRKYILPDDYIKSSELFELIWTKD